MIHLDLYHWGSSILHDNEDQLSGQLSTATSINLSVVNNIDIISVEDNIKINTEKLKKY